MVPHQQVCRLLTPCAAVLLNCAPIANQMVPFIFSPEDPVSIISYFDRTDHNGIFHFAQIL